MHGEVVFHALDADEYIVRQGEPRTVWLGEIECAEHSTLRLRALVEAHGGVVHMADIQLEHRQSPDAEWTTVAKFDPLEANGPVRQAAHWQTFGPVHKHVRIRAVLSVGGNGDTTFRIDVRGEAVP